MFIFQLVGAVLIFLGGVVTNERVPVVFIDPAGNVENKVVSRPIIVDTENNKVTVRGPIRTVSSEKILPFRRDSFGQWTVDCQGECNDRGISR